MSLRTPIRFALCLLTAAPLTLRAEDTTGAVTAGSAFNPQASLILTGHYADDNRNGHGDTLIDDAPGIARGVVFGSSTPETGNGFSLGDSELVLAATVDPYFDGRFIGTFDGHGAANVEEAWLETRQLPYGIKVKAGRLKSGIGYENAQHQHAWDFDDQNLAYSALLGSEGLSDTGVQATWLTPAPFYLLVGAESLQGGDSSRFGTLVTASDAATVLAASAGSLPEQGSGPRLTTAFAKASPDLGDNHALQLGVSLAHARQFQQVRDPDNTPLSGDEYALDGSQTLYGADLVYKYDSPGELGEGDVKVVAEYLRLQSDATVTGADTGAVFSRGSSVQGTEDGYYAQVTYGIAPRWQLGFRHDVAGSKNELVSGATRVRLQDSSRNTLALGFSPSEFSRLRLQVAKGDIANAAGTHTPLNQVLLTYTLSLGTHGAHAF